MAHAYTPGLKVTKKAVIRKTRRLPIPGEVLVEKGQKVSPDTIMREPVSQVIRRLLTLPIFWA